MTLAGSCLQIDDIVSFAVDRAFCQKHHLRRFRVEFLGRSFTELFERSPVFLLCFRIGVKNGKRRFRLRVFFDQSRIQQRLRRRLILFDAPAAGKTQGRFVKSVRITQCGKPHGSAESSPAEVVGIVHLDPEAVFERNEVLQFINSVQKTQIVFVFRIDTQDPFDGGDRLPVDLRFVRILQDGLLVAFLQKFGKTDDDLLEHVVQFFAVFIQFRKLVETELQFFFPRHRSLSRNTERIRERSGRQDGPRSRGSHFGVLHGGPCRLRRRTSGFLHRRHRAASTSSFRCSLPSRSPYRPGSYP